MAEKKVSNFVELSGKIRWPESKFTLNGNQLFKAKLAVPNGKNTTYIRILAWDDKAESMAKLKEGDEIKLHGRLGSRSFDGKCKACKADQKVYITEVIVDNFVLLD